MVTVNGSCDFREAVRQVLVYELPLPIEYL